jgi:hypothetical protein
MQAPGFKCLPFDPFLLQQSGLAAPEVDVGRCEVAQNNMRSNERIKLLYHFRSDHHDIRSNHLMS